MNSKDSLLKLELDLPNGAGSATTEDSIDLGHNSTGKFLAQCEVVLSCPALAVGDLPDAETMQYQIIESDNADLSSPTVVATLEKAKQTGAGGAGAAAKTVRYRIPTDAKRYLGLKATNSGAGDASDKTATLELVF